MEESFNDPEEARETGDLVQDVFMYLTEHRYPPCCTEPRKRTIRRKAAKFAIRDGEFFFKKKK